MKESSALHPGRKPAVWTVESKLPDEVQRNIDRVVQSEDVRYVAIMPDVHLGREVNNGTVMATTCLVYPQAIGADIGCGFSLLGFQSDSRFLQEEETVALVFRCLHQTVPVLKHRGSRVLPERLLASRLSDPILVKASQRDGALQLGTLGCGNHFLEVQEDDAGKLWAMVHSGSRAMGQTITEFHRKRGAALGSGLVGFDLRSEPGQAYFHDMEWAVQYATLSRLAMLAQFASLLESEFGIEADEDTYIDCPHNFARRETHFGEELVVHRKSANSANLNEPGIVAGSMGSPSFIVRGLGHDHSLRSSSHGAGRLMSRTQARSSISRSEMRGQLGGVHHEPRSLDSLRDEAPGAYRDIRQVMRAQRDLVRQTRRLRPILSFKYPDTRRPQLSSPIQNLPGIR